MSASNETNFPRQRGPLRRGLTAAALVAGGIVIGAGGLAVAGGEMGPMGPMGGGMMGWHHHHHHGFRLEMLQRRVRGALDNVGATAAQEDKVHDIIAGAATEIDKDKEADGGGRGAMRQQLLDLMKAPTLDRAAFEKLRADKIAAMDAKSKVISNALFDAASQLSPEQRSKLVGEFQAGMDHGGWRHHRDGDMGHDDMGHGDMGHGDMGHGDMDHGDAGHGGDHGPDHPDHG